MHRKGRAHKPQVLILSNNTKLRAWSCKRQPASNSFVKTGLVRETVGMSWGRESDPVNTLILT